MNVLIMRSTPRRSRRVAYPLGCAVCGVGLGIVLLFAPYLARAQDDVPTIVDPVDVFGYGPIAGIEWAPDGSCIALAGSNLVYLINPDDGSTIRRIAGHERSVLAVRFTSDSQSVWSASRQLLQRWDLATGDLSFSINTGLYLENMALHPSDTLIAATDHDRVVIFDCHTGEIVHTLEAPPTEFRVLAFGASRSTLYSTGNHESVRRWDLESKAITGEIPLRTDPFNLVVSPDGGRMMLTRSAHEEEPPYDLAYEVGLDDFSIQRTFSSTYNEYFVDFAYINSPHHPGPSIIAAGSSWEIWDLDASTPNIPEVYTASPFFPIKDMASHPSAPLFVVTDSHATLHQFQLGIYDPVQVWGDGHFAEIRCGEISRDGSCFVSGDLQGILQVRAVESGKLLRRIVVNPRPPTTPFGSHILDLALCENDTQALVVCENSGSYLSASRYDLQTGTLLTTYGLTGDFRQSLRVVHDEPHRRFFVGHSRRADFNLIGWHLDSTTPTHLFDLSGDVNALDVSPDGNHLLAGADHNLYLCDLASTVPLLLPSVHESDRIRGVAFNPADPSEAASADSHGRLLIWDLETQEIRHHITNEDVVSFIHVTYTPDGDHILACAGFSGTLYVYETESAELVMRIAGFERPPWVVEYDPGGPWIYLAEDNTIRKYDATIPKAGVGSAWQSFR